MVDGQGNRWTAAVGWSRWAPNEHADDQCVEPVRLHWIHDNDRFHGVHEALLGRIQTNTFEVTFYWRK